jgi:branched-chain amino acid transport system permease protein
MDFSNFFELFLPNTVGGLAIGAIYALIALGYTMVYGVLRLINFAHSEIFMIATFATLLVFTTLDVSAPLGTFALIGVLLLAMVFAALVTGGSAVLLETIAYRPLRKHGASRLAALISAIGASLFLQEFFALIVLPLDGNPNGRVFRESPRVVERDVLFTIGNASVRLDHVIIIVAALVMMIALDQLVNRTRIGRGIRATAQDPEAAVLMGVNIDTIVRITFFLGGAMAGIAGVLYLMELEATNFRVGFLLGIKAFTAAVLGGIGNLRGALLGGFVLGLIENWGSGLLGSDWKNVIAFTVLVLILLIRPTGILGESLQRARA